MGRYLGLNDMPQCRACGCAPVVKTTTSGDGSMRLQCPECGIRTGMSTNEQASFERWAKAMTGGTVYCPLEHAWIDGCPYECEMCPGTGA
ncbi:hypothetical protein [Gordonibacter urolithinfaciens]|uniref:hypothetical protein n=1 Tax=Gordonibacter urolithinfaciens TaxID=1335613 RepID=UPI003AAE87AB